MDYEKSLKETLERQLAKRDGQTPEKLAASIRYSLLATGKRIRPRLLLAAAEMMGLETQAAIPAAHALEMIHCFTLIHDDLPCMDDDDLRRGQPSNHKKFNESTALLAGDALIPLAIETYLEAESTGLPAARLNAGLKRLLAACGPRGVTGGQALEETLNNQSTLEQLQKMHALKTGALFEAALLIPMEMQGIGTDSPAGLAIHLFARELGLAFQVADDLEDAGQDTASDNSSTDATNILTYLPKAEVQSMTLGRLAQATRALEAVYGEKAKNLRLIADEVARSIGGPTPTQIQTSAALAPDPKPAQPKSTSELDAESVKAGKRERSARTKA